MRLAICVVYVIEPGWEWLLDLHLRKIRACTTVPFRILAATPRLSEAAREMLEACPEVVFPDLPPTSARQGAEHGHYMDGLLAHAAAGDFTHFATFDADSFPLAPGWAERLIARLGPATPFAAVLRAENGDRILPHPSGMIGEIDFIRTHAPRFYPEGDAAAEDFARRNGQRFDTGIGYARVCEEAGVDWLPLLRSNAREEHVLLAGIYGDEIFHLGASSRAPVFHADWLATPARRAAWHWRKGRLGRRIFQRVQRQLIRQNEPIQARICDALRTDPDAFLTGLRGRAA